MEEIGDGIRAWLFLSRVETYVAAWRARDVRAALEPVLEQAPFESMLPPVLRYACPPARRDAAIRQIVDANAVGHVRAQQRVDVP